MQKIVRNENLYLMVTPSFDMVLNKLKKHDDGESKWLKYIKSLPNTHIICIGDPVQYIDYRHPNFDVKNPQKFIRTGYVNAFGVREKAEEKFVGVVVHSKSRKDGKTIVANIINSRVIEKIQIKNYMPV